MSIKKQQSPTDGKRNHVPLVRIVFSTGNTVGKFEGDKYGWSMFLDPVSSPPFMSFLLLYRDEGQ